MQLRATSLFGLGWQDNCDTLIIAAFLCYFFLSMNETKNRRSLVWNHFVPHSSQVSIYHIKVLWIIIVFLGTECQQHATFCRGTLYNTKTYLSFLIKNSAREVLIFFRSWFGSLCETLYILGSMYCGDELPITRDLALCTGAEKHAWSMLAEIPAAAVSNDMGMTMP